MGGREERGRREGGRLSNNMSIDDRIYGGRREGDVEKEGRGGWREVNSKWREGREGGEEEKWREGREGGGEEEWRGGGEEE